MTKQVEVQRAASEKAPSKGLGILNRFQTSKGERDEVDSEIRIEAIKHFPEFAKTMQEVFLGFRKIGGKVIKSGSESVQSCYSGSGEVRRAYIELAKGEDATFEQKKYYMERAEVTVSNDALKDTEHKGFLRGVMAVVLFAGGAVSAVAIHALSGKDDSELLERLEEIAA